MNGTTDRRAALIIVDSAAAFAAVMIGARLRFGADLSSIWEVDLSLPPVFALAGAFGLLTFACFAIAGSYRREVHWSLESEMTDHVKGLALLAAVTLGLLYLFKLEDVSRLVLAFSFASLALAGLVARSWLRRRARAASLEGRSLRNWLIVGYGPKVAQIVDLVEHNRHIGARVVGTVGPNAEPDPSVPWLGGLEDLSDAISKIQVDEVIVVFDAADWTKLESVIAACAEQGKTVRMPLDTIAPTILRGRFEEFDGMPMWSILATSQHDLALAVKRVFDFIASAALVVVLSPLLGLAALAIAAIDGRPVLFRQRRGGLHGRTFEMLKFRTMVKGAEEMRYELLGGNERTGPVFKMREDPRVTRLGRWLRRSSIDELPQLFNVLAGNMSLVGPRPQPMTEVDAYDIWHRRRLSMRPGITGLWQVNARHDPSFEKWMDLDLEYIDRWSLLLDAQVLIRTPAALFRTPGE